MDGFSRRYILGMAAAAAILQGRPKAVALPGVNYRDYSRCLPDYLRRLADQARRQRDAALTALTTKAAIKARQTWVRRTFTDLIGGLPARTALNTTVTGTFERDGYRVDRLFYESRPQYFITANFYRPTKQTTPFPGVLFQMGHSPNGKAYDSYQRACQALARLGFAVLAFDPMGQGERIYYPDQSGLRTRFSSVDDEHSTPGRQMLLVGTTCSQLQLWDALRSLDVLAAHPDVDPARLASVGQSGGATMTMMLAAMDDRLAVAAVMSGNTENFACPDFLSPGSVDDAEQNFVGSGPVGFDRFDLLYPFAPKPLLISISDKDFLGTYSPNYVLNSRIEFERLQSVYRYLGAEERLHWAHTPLPHGLSYDSRIAMYNWLAKHLLRSPEAVVQEPAVRPEPDYLLWVTASGSTVTGLHSETPFSLIRKQSDLLSAAPGVATPLRQLLHLDPLPVSEWTQLDRVPSAEKVSIIAAEVKSATDVFLPVWVFQGERDSSQKPVILLLDAHGRNSSWREGGLCQTLAQEGFVVCSADVRGIGDLTPAFEPKNPAYAREHETEESYAWASLILGRPLLGQRVTDILALAACLRKQFAARPLALVASDRLTIPALLAASLDSSIVRIYLAGGLASFRSLISEEVVSHPFANWLPDLLKAQDIPGMIHSLAPRRVVLAGPVDANGRAIELSAVSSLFHDALAAGHLQLKQNRAWTAAAIAAFLNDS